MRELSCRILSLSLWLTAAWFVPAIFHGAWAQDGCARSEPEAYFDSTHPQITRLSFERLNEHEAVEQFRIGSGQLVKIQHGGCESFVNVISVTVKRSPSAQGLNEQRRIMSSLINHFAHLGAHSAFDLRRVAKTLGRLTSKAVRKQGTQTAMVKGDGEGFLQTKLMFNSAAHGKAQIELILTLSKGPL